MRFSRDKLENVLYYPVKKVNTLAVTLCYVTLHSRRQNQSGNAHVTESCFNPKSDKIPTH